MQFNKVPTNVNRRPPVVKKSRILEDFWQILHMDQPESVSSRSIVKLGGPRLLPEAKPGG